MMLLSPSPNQISASGRSAIAGSGLNIEVKRLEQVVADAGEHRQRRQQEGEPQAERIALQQQADGVGCLARQLAGR